MCTFGDLPLTLDLLRWSQRVPRATRRLAHHSEPGSKGVLVGRFCAEMKIGSDRPKSGSLHIFERRERNFDRPSCDHVRACASRCGTSKRAMGDDNPIKTRCAASKNLKFWSENRPFFRRCFALEGDINEHACQGTIAL